MGLLKGILYSDRFYGSAEWWTLHEDEYSETFSGCWRVGAASNAQKLYAMSHLQATNSQSIQQKWFIETFLHLGKAINAWRKSQLCFYWKNMKNTYPSKFNIALFQKVPKPNRKPDRLPTT